VRELPVEVVVTVGHQIDPAELGPQPANVRMERYIPQSTLLPGCDLVVSHGGSGSVLGPPAHGLPMVLVPLGADGPLNARRCEALGVGRTLDPVRVTAEQAREEVAAVPADVGVRRAALGLRDELAALPEPTAAVTSLERLAGHRRGRR
jgi:MGT family glycosyltransferase